MIDDIKAGLKDIKYTINIESPDDEKRLMDLAERVIAHCPVVDSLKRPVNVFGEINIRN